MTDIIDRLNAACVGHPNARIPWPHRLLHDAAAEITRLRTALSAIRDITGDTHRERPYTALSEIDQIARRGLAP